jgi:hypothetical protein
VFLLFLRPCREFRIGIKTCGSGRQDRRLDVVQLTCAALPSQRRLLPPGLGTLALVGNIGFWSYEDRRLWG